MANGAAGRRLETIGNRGELRKELAGGVAVRVWGTLFVARALLRAASRLFSTLVRGRNISEPLKRLDLAGCQKNVKRNTPPST